MLARYAGGGTRGVVELPRNKPVYAVMVQRVERDAAYGELSFQSMTFGSGGGRLETGGGSEWVPAVHPIVDKDAAVRCWQVATWANSCEALTVRWVASMLLVPLLPRLERVMRPALASLLLVVLPSLATAQLGPWTPSPSRANVWFALLPATSSDWLGTRALLDRDYAGLGAELCSITSSAEQALVITLAGAGAGNGVYIGITDFQNEGEWRWLDGTPVTYTNWLPGSPSTSPLLGSHQQDFGLTLPVGWQDIGHGGFGDQDAVVVLHSPDCDANQSPDRWDIWRGVVADANGNGVPDICESIGSTYCVATVNSSGNPARIAAAGSLTVAANDVHLRAWQLPLNSPGYFLASRTPDFVPMFAGSPGNLCLGQPIVRLGFLPGGVLDSGPLGTVLLPLDLTIVNSGSAVGAGEQWHFQYWTRDIFSTNTSDAVRLDFQ